MIYRISIEGQTIEMPEEIAGDDEKLKSALVPYFPGAANAKIMRTGEKDGIVVVTVIKQAGTKGALPLLLGLPESRNPVAELHQEILKKRVTAAMRDEQTIEMSDMIEKAIDQGSEQNVRILKTLQDLENMPAEASTQVPEGF